MRTRPIRPRISASPSRCIARLNSQPVRLLVLLLCVCWCTSTSALEYRAQDAAIYGGTGNDDGRTVRVAPNGDVLLVGTFIGTGDMGGPPLVAAHYGTNYFLARYAAAVAPTATRLPNVLMVGFRASK